MKYYDMVIKNKKDELEKAKEGIQHHAYQLAGRMNEIVEGAKVYGLQDLDNRFVWLRNAVAEVEKLEKEIKIMEETKEALEFDMGKELTKRLTASDVEEAILEDVRKNK